MSPQGLMHSYLLAQICVRALMHMSAWDVHVCKVFVCALCTCVHTGKRKRKRNREAEAGRVWFLVTEKLEHKGTVLVWEWGAEATWHCLSRNQDLRRPWQRALALGPVLPHSSSPSFTSIHPPKGTCHPDPPPFH